MQEVKGLFDRIEKLYPGCVDEIILNRGDFLIRQDQVEHFTYFIKEGAVAVKHFKGNETHTIRFGYRGSYLNSLPSFFDGSPSRFAIIALRKTLVKRYAKSAIMNVTKNEETYRDAYIKILENLASQFVEREIDLLASSPAERYQRVLERSPQLFEEVPLKHIADYLRMTPETLSRLRKS